MAEASNDQALNRSGSPGHSLTLCAQAIIGVNPLFPLSGFVENLMPRPRYTKTLTLNFLHRLI